VRSRDNEDFQREVRKEEQERTQMAGAGKQRPYICWELVNHFFLPPFSIGYSAFNISAGGGSAFGGQYWFN